MWLSAWLETRTTPTPRWKRLGTQACSWPQRPTSRAVLPKPEMCGGLSGCSALPLGRVLREWHAPILRAHAMDAGNSRFHGDERNHQRKNNPLLFPDSSSRAPFTRYDPLSRAARRHTQVLQSCRMRLFGFSGSTRKRDPLKKYSDNGPQFIAKDFKEFPRISGMTRVRTSPFYSQSNGKIERRHLRTGS